MTVTQSKIMDHFLWINSCQEFIYFCSYFAPDIHYHIVIYAENIVSQILFLQRSTLWELGIKSFKTHICSYIHMKSFIIVYLRIVYKSWTMHLIRTYLTSELAIKLPHLNLFFYYWLCYFFVVYYYWIKDWMESFIKTDTKQKQMNYNCIRK